MPIELISIRLAHLEDRHLWDREPEPNGYEDEIWENAYADLEEEMYTPTRQFRRRVGSLLVRQWRAEDRTVRLIAERAGVIVGYLSFQQESGFHRTVQARITEMRLMLDWHQETLEQNIYFSKASE